jgi:hypothetical protein
MYECIFGVIGQIMLSSRIKGGQLLKRVTLVSVRITIVSFFREMVGISAEPTHPGDPRVAGQRRHLRQPRAAPVRQRSLSPLHRPPRPRSVVALLRRPLLLHILGRHPLGQTHSEALRLDEHHHHGALAGGRHRLPLRRHLPGRGGQVHQLRHSEPERAEPRQGRGRDRGNASISSSSTKT